MAKRWLWGVTVGVLALAVIPSAARARVATPVLGDWEGLGIHDIPISFVFSRVHGRIVVQDLVIGLPEACARASTSWLAEPFPRVSYSGPGAPPAFTLTAQRRNQMMLLVHLSSSPFPLPIDGSLLSPRRAVLSLPLVGTVVSRCKWPSTLTWHVHPAHRVPVADGTWTGQVQAPGAASAPLTLKVTAQGRIVDYVSLNVTCIGGSTGGFSVGPGAGEFISADGSFASPGFGGWTGTFGPDGTARGMSFDPGACTGSSLVTGPFTATLSGP